jgi:hypothetical protein
VAVKGGAQFFNGWLRSVDGDEHITQLSPQLQLSPPFRGIARKYRGLVHEHRRVAPIGFAARDCLNACRGVVLLLYVVELIQNIFICVLKGRGPSCVLVGRGRR